jgi:hypothetical protein
LEMDVSTTRRAFCSLIQGDIQCNYIFFLDLNLKTDE